MPPVNPISTEDGIVLAGSVWASTCLPSTLTVTVWPETPTPMAWLPVRSAGTLVAVAAKARPPPLVPVARPMKLADG